MKMRKYILALAATLAVCGCSLKEKLVSSSASGDFYNNYVECQTGVNGCYNLVRSILGGHNFWLLTDCQTDCMILNQSLMYNATLNISPTRPGIGATVWQYGYMGVMRTNSMLAAIDNCYQRGGITDRECLSLKAEAVTLRAFFYYLLTCTFGDVPYYTEPVTEFNRARIAALPRMSADDTRDALIDELMMYVMPAQDGGLEAFPFKRSYDAPFQNRMTAPVALMLAGKMCMWNERWDDAVKVLGVLEDIYGSYAENPEAFGLDYPLSDVPFSKKFTKESILEIANTFEEYGTQQAGYIAVITTPSKTTQTLEDEEGEYTITDVYAGIGIPELGTQSRISTSARPTTYYFETVLSYDSPDLRSGEYSAGATSARGGSGNLAWRWRGYAMDDTERLPEDNIARWFKQGSSATAANLTSIQRPWLGNKFWCPNMYYTMDSNNPKFFRYADALLMLAEAHLRAGHTDMATDYLNVTRVRAGLEKLSMASVGDNVEAMMEEIRLERARELFGEFQRKFDLVRWGIWYERTLAYNDGMYLQDFIQPYHRYLPIPAEQITYSGGALDNKEYGE